MGILLYRVWGRSIIREGLRHRDDGRGRNLLPRWRYDALLELCRGMGDGRFWGIGALLLCRRMVRVVVVVGVVVVVVVSSLLPSLTSLLLSLLL